MVGCRHGAKNTLDKNYLWFAEKLGTEIRPETLVTGIEEDGQGGWLVHTRRSTRKLFRGRRTVRARGVVLAAGALGTVNLLLEGRDRGTLPRLSPALGSYVRTNSEVICGATARSDERGLLAGHRHRQRLPPRSGHLRRGRPLSQGLGCDELPRHAPGGRRHPRQPAPQVARHLPAASRGLPAHPESQGLGEALDHRAGDAEPRQLVPPRARAALVLAVRQGAHQPARAGRAAHPGATSRSPTKPPGTSPGRRTRSLRAPSTRCCSTCPRPPTSWAAPPWAPRRPTA